MGDLDIATAIVQAAENQYVATRRTLFQGIQYCLPFDALSVAKRLARVVDFHGVEFVRGLCSYHWLIESNTYLSTQRGPA